MALYNPPLHLPALSIFNDSEYNYVIPNTGDVTLTTIGSTPNASGCSLVGQQLQLQPASTSYPGVMTTGTQSIAGAKTFTSNINTTGVYQISGTQITTTALSDTVAVTSYSANCAGATTSSFTLTYAKMGSAVRIQFADFSFTAGASDTLRFQLPTLSPSIFPTQTLFLFYTLSASGTNATACLTISTSGLITWYSGTSFTTSLTNGTAYIVRSNSHSWLC